MILATFPDDAALSRAAARFGAARIPAETFSPTPLDGAPSGSPIPCIILAAGLLGAAASFGVQTYASLIGYRMNVGNRPDFAWASFIPTVFENAVLAAILAGFVAFFWINGLPRLYDPVDEFDSLRAATTDGWFLHVPSNDPAIASRAHALLAELHATRVEERA